MAKKPSGLKKLLKKYITVMNYKTLIAVILSILATWVSYYFRLIFNLDMTLISVAVVFPLVFTLGSAFQRRERALEHLGRAKGALSAIKYCFSFAKKIDDEEKEKIYSEIKNVKKQLIAYLYSESDDKAALNESVSKIQGFIVGHKGNIGRALSLRVYRLMRDVIMGIENSIAIKSHRTPMSIRAYCELFIYVFPFFNAPTLIKNIEYQNMGFGEIINTPTLSFMDNPYDIIVYGLNIAITFFLITLFNIQEQIENPYDQEGLDDIKLENYIIDY